MGKISRKDFFKKACVAGACICGFSSLFIAEGKAQTQIDEPVDDKLKMVRSWLSVLLENINRELDEESRRNILKGCAVVHYEQLNMDEVLSPYVGNLSAFMAFLESNWGWKVSYDTESETLIADENKDYCVCPIINTRSEEHTSELQSRENLVCRLLLEKKNKGSAEAIHKKEETHRMAEAMRAFAHFR